MSRQFGRNITINGHSAHRNATTYETQVNEVLLAITMFRTGQAVLSCIWNSHRHVTIVPWHGDMNAPNADSTPVNPRAATLLHDLVRDGTGQHPPHSGRGTGGGSNVIVHYTPWLWPTDLVPRWDPIAAQNWQALLGWPVFAGQDMDEMLLHELVHAAEQTHGRIGNKPTGDNFDIESDFHAILVTNLFQRERNRPARLDHHGFRNAASPTAIVPNAGDFWRRVEQFRLRNPDLTADLAQIPVSGNPFGGRAAFQQVWPPITR